MKWRSVGTDCTWRLRTVSTVGKRFRVKGGRPPMTVWTGLYPGPSRSAGRAERFTYGKLNLMLPLPSTARISPPGRKMFTTTASYLAREGKAPLNAPWHSQWTRPVCGRPILVPGIHRRPIPTEPCFRPSWPFPNTGSPLHLTLCPHSPRVSRIRHPPLPFSYTHFLTRSRSRTILSPTPISISIFYPLDASTDI